MITFPEATTLEVMDDATAKNALIAILTAIDGGTYMDRYAFWAIVEAESLTRP